MEAKKIEKGEGLQTALLELGEGETLKVPYRLYSEKTIRATASQLKAKNNRKFKIAVGNAYYALITYVS